MEYLFSYGTLQNANVQLRLLGRVLKGSNDIIRGFKTGEIEIMDPEFIKNGDGKLQRIAVASVNENDFIAGKVLEVSEQELSVLDQYEPKEYSRVLMTLDSGKKAWVYCKAA